MTQLALPVDVQIPEILRQRTLGASIELCVNAAGFESKALQSECGFDKAQYSRWLGGEEGIKWDRFTKLMDRCGNHAPLMWMLHDRGYDLHSVRKLESETQKALRLSQEENAALRRLLMGAV